MEKYIVSNTIKYSDGTETVVNYSQNNDSEAIEAIVEENLVDNQNGETTVEDTDASPDGSQDSTDGTEEQITE